MASGAKVATMTFAGAAALAAALPDVAKGMSAATAAIPGDTVLLVALAAAPGLLSAAIVFIGASLLAGARREARAPLDRCGRRRRLPRHLRPVRERRVEFATGLAAYRRTMSLRLDTLERHLACIPGEPGGRP